MRNHDVAVPGACVTRRSGLWIAQAILFAASFLIVNQGFAQGSNFRVVYAEVEGVSALEAGDLARGMRILKSQLKKADDREPESATKVIPAGGKVMRLIRITARGGVGKGNWFEPGANRSGVGLGQVRVYGQEARH